MNWAITIGASLALTGCVSARVVDSRANELFRDGRASEAAAHLEARFEARGKDHRDSLLYRMDLGILHRAAGQLERSTEVLLEADREADIKDYTSISAQAGSLLVGENLTHYRAEEFESVLINTYLAMNFAESSQFEEALIESRRVNRKLYLLRSEGKRQYASENAFASYLTGVLFESQGEWNDAYVSYKKARESAPWMPEIGRDLFRVSTRLGIRDEADQWRRTYSLTSEDQTEALRSLDRKKMGVILVIFENGLSPEKIPNPNWYQIPKFKRRWNPVAQAEVVVVQENFKTSKQTDLLFDIESMAIANLDEKYAALIAKRVGGAVAKEIAAQGVARLTKNDALGDLTRLLLWVSDQADLRSWSLLPKDLQVARFVVPSGPTTIHLYPIGYDSPQQKQVEIQPGELKVLSFRFVP